MILDLLSVAPFGVCPELRGSKAWVYSVLLIAQHIGSPIDVIPALPTLSPVISRSM